MAANAAEYVQHHLTQWQWSPTGDITSFWTFNLDTIIMSILCGLVFIGVFRYAIAHASIDKPGKFQLFIEEIVLLVDDKVTATLGKRDDDTCGLALCIFVWIWLMNFLDMVPVDLIPFITSKMGLEYFKAVPTADLSMTAALALSVVVFVNIEGIKSHGIKGYLWEMLSHPFSIYAFPVNLFFRLLEEVTRPFSLALRLFGNMFAGELIFFLIALTPMGLQLFAGWFWLGLHVLVITLQAFIFMVLTIVYIGMAKNSH